MSILLAIDPGKTGAIAAFTEGLLSGIFACDAATLNDALFPGTEVVIEQVNGVPGQSAPAAFNFGRRYGELLGVCIANGIEPVLVAPMIWKGALGLRRGTMTNTEFKTASRELVSKLYPDHAHLFARAKDDGSAEAVLIGHWYLHHHK